MSRYTFYLLEQDCTSYAHFFRKDINREFRVSMFLSTTCIACSMNFWSNSFVAIFQSYYLIDEHTYSAASFLYLSSYYTASPAYAY